jgi:cytochrome c5
MKRSQLVCAALTAGSALMALSALWAQQTDTVDVSRYPAEVQQQYKVFAQKCSRCHDLSRPLTAKYSTEAQWRDMVARMARKPGAGISKKDQDTVTAFLVYHQQAKSGAAPAAAPPATGTGKPATGVAAYPPEVQKQYKSFADKCSRCHDLARPLTAKYSTEAQWRDLVVRMARKPGGGIGPKDQDAITAFLVYNQKARSGVAAAAAVTTGTVAPTSAPAVPVSPAEVIPAAPGTAAQATDSKSGLRVEVDALPAQPITVPADGKWTTEAPGEGETLFLSVRLVDEATGEKVPYATIRARVGDENAEAKELRPLFGAKGFQYGRNFAAPAGDLQVSLEVQPPVLARVGDDGRGWNSPLHLKLTLRGR